MLTDVDWFNSQHVTILNTSQLTATLYYGSLHSLLAGPSGRAVQGIGLRPLAC